MVPRATSTRPEAICRSEVTQGTRLADWLRQRGVDEVDIVGIATDYCVLATAKDAAEAGFTTRVLLDLTAGVATESSAKAVEDMRAAGVEVTAAAA